MIFFRRRTPVLIPKTPVGHAAICKINVAAKKFSLNIFLQFVFIIFQNDIAPIRNAAALLAHHVGTKKVTIQNAFFFIFPPALAGYIYEWFDFLAPAVIDIREIILCNWYFYFIRF
ncbi:MAG: hypothetical protein LBG69_03975 [Zoogloeaceae bacterium]|nr:hypothetical protein [Zoogloeaceae bacterium]